jgi:hydroxyethylthiazole kinase-like sugar kinase family protein
MRYKIHFSYAPTNLDEVYEDEIVIRGKSHVEIRELAYIEMESRGIDSRDWWAERIDGGQ